MSDDATVLLSMLNKRPRRTKAAIRGICDEIKAVLEADPPMTVRQVFYQLVVRGVIEKTEGGLSGHRYQIARRYAPVRGNPVLIIRR